ncbi:MAG TPA: hypothetical protein PKZ97_10925, partial [Azospirillaceae bacterium]|nr:hypothetical protein [Azospirillaceae bacterium]
MSEDALREEIRRAAGIMSFIGLGGEAREISAALLSHGDAALKAVVSVVAADADQDRGDGYFAALLHLVEVLASDLAQAIERGLPNAPERLAALRRQLIGLCDADIAPGLMARVVSALLNVGLEPGE